MQPAATKLSAKLSATVQDWRPEGVNKTYRTRAHHILRQDDEGPHGEGAVLPEAIEEDLGHGLSDATVHQTVKVLAHAKCERYVHRCGAEILT